MSDRTSFPHDNPQSQRGLKDYDVQLTKKITTTSLVLVNHKSSHSFPPSPQTCPSISPLRRLALTSP